MPKFLVTSGSHFKPFTYDELVRPVAEAAAAHNATQDAYDTLTTETEALRQYIMQEPNDSEARRMYNAYVSQLSELQNDLWNNGYNASTRRGLSAARAGYASDITRLGTAIKTRQDRSNEYWKTKHDHPDMIMGSDPGTESLDKYLANDRFGQDYYSYSGDVFANEVAVDAGARMKEMLEDPKILTKYPQLKGYIPILKKNGFTSTQVDNAVAAVYDYYNGSSSKMSKLDPGSSILANILVSHLESTGARGKVDKSEFNRLIKYGAAGLSKSIGDSNIEFLHDLEWAEQQKQARENEKYQHALNVARAKASGNAGREVPPIATLRGNEMNGISDSKQSKDFIDKKKVYDALKTINELKKSGAIRQPNGTLSDAANKAILQLKDSPYYLELTKDKKKFLSETDLDPVIKNLEQEIQKAETNDHMYQFQVKPASASNIARTVFKPNIGQLSGKRNAKVSESVAHYSDGKAVEASQLKALLESNNLLIGFDAKTGRITVQRNASDDSSEVGKYNDKVVYLNTKTILAGTNGLANTGSLLYAFDASLPENVPDTKSKEYRQKIEALSNSGQVVDLRMLAELIHNSYQPLMKKGTDDDKAVFNSLVEAFAQGLFDSSNAQWAPNDFKEGWSDKTGGDYLYDYYNDSEDE